jgi:predicted secreted protein
VSWLTLAAVYFILWWLVWFAVLPWGVRSQHEAEAFDRRSEPGAPQQPMLLIKLVATTLVSAMLLAIGVYVWRAEWIPFDRIPMPFTLPSE